MAGSVAHKPRPGRRARVAFLEDPAHHRGQDAAATVGGEHSHPGDARGRQQLTARHAHAEGEDRAEPDLATVGDGEDGPIELEDLPLESRSPDAVKPKARSSSRLMVSQSSDVAPRMLKADWSGRLIATSHGVPTAEPTATDTSFA